MERSRLVDYLVGRMVRIEQPHPVRVAIDGPDAAGKSTLADELVEPLQARGRHAIRASIDGFHNPSTVRYRRGHTSPEGYYYDSFNYTALIESLLTPLGPGGSRRYVPEVFDYHTDSEARTQTREAEVNAVLIFDGVFLLRPELVGYWDFTVFVDAAFEVTLARAERRDAAFSGSVEEVRRRYNHRYIPGQKLYFAQSQPRERAGVVVDNNDPLRPSVSSHFAATVA